MFRQVSCALLRRGAEIYSDHDLIRRWQTWRNSSAKKESVGTDRRTKMRSRTWVPYLRLRLKELPSIQLLTFHKEKELDQPSDRNTALEHVRARCYFAALKKGLSPDAADDVTQITMLEL